MGYRILQLKRSAICVCLTVMMTAAAATAQNQSGKVPKPGSEPKAESPAPPEKVSKSNPVPKFKTPPPPPRISRISGVTEKALAVDPAVNVKIPCLQQARVTINGWQRNEVRVFIKNGSGVNFKVHENDVKSGKPVWIVIARQIEGRSSTPQSECITGERIEIEVPMQASISMQGRATEARIDSIKKIDIKNVGGRVSIRNISGGISAYTYDGDITVENSSGQIALETSTGNVLAYDVKPGEVGELFKAKTTSGEITLQKVDHRQIQADSISGSVVFNGKFLAGGLYGFKTQKGSVKLALPQEASCELMAWYGYGSLTSELPMKILTETESSAGKAVTAKIGGGQATVKVSTTHGEIIIVKQ